MFAKRPVGLPIHLAGATGHALLNFCQLVLIGFEDNFEATPMNVVMVLFATALPVVSWALLGQPAWSLGRPPVSAPTPKAGLVAGAAAATAMLGLGGIFLGVASEAAIDRDLMALALAAVFAAVCGVAPVIALRRWWSLGKPYQPVFGGILIGVVSILLSAMLLGSTLAG
jgi:hypothetical protein